MKKDRHYYYKELEKNDNLLNDKLWLKEALKCTLEKHCEWTVSEKSLNTILSNDSYTKNDYLDFISMNNKKIAADLRKLEGLE